MDMNEDNTQDSAPALQNGEGKKLKSDTSTESKTNSEKPNKNKKRKQIDEDNKKKQILDNFIRQDDSATTKEDVETYLNLLLNQKDNSDNSSNDEDEPTSAVNRSNLNGSRSGQSLKNKNDINFEFMDSDQSFFFKNALIVGFLRHLESNVLNDPNLVNKMKDLPHGTGFVNYLTNLLKVDEDICTNKDKEFEKKIDTDVGVNLLLNLIARKMLETLKLSAWEITDSRKKKTIKKNDVQTIFLRKPKLVSDFLLKNQ